jgi:hypothetical protein
MTAKAAKRRPRLSRQKNERKPQEVTMYAAVMSFILLLPWGLAALTTIGYFRSRRPAVARVVRRRDPRDLI